MAESIPIDAEIADLLHSLHHRLRRASRTELEPMGITPALARALRVIGRSTAPIRMSDLADQLRIARRSATSVVDELFERKLITRCDDPSDRRAVAVELSDDGQALMHELRHRRRAASTAIVATLSTADRRQLRDLLRKLDGDQGALD